MPIDHRRRLNVISTSVTYSPAARVPTFFSFSLLVINLRDSISRGFIFDGDFNRQISKKGIKFSDFSVLNFVSFFKKYDFFKNF